MKLGSLKPSPGIRKARKRVGRGNGSGYGGTSGRGHKGYHSRSGSKRRAWYEGGQMPLQRRVPKRGFSNDRFKKTYQIVNLARLANLGLKEVDINTMVERGLVSSASKPVKILGGGKISVPMSISANAFSKAAIEKIKNAGGKVIVV